MSLKEVPDIFEGKLENIQYIEELKRWLEEKNIEIGDVCLSGSAILTFYGIRQNNDLEIILNKKARRILQIKEYKKIHIWGHIPVTEHIDLFKNQYAVIGYGDNYIFKKKKYIEEKGFKIINPEYEYKYKVFLLKYLYYREKDINDMHRLEELGFGKNLCREKLLKDGAVGLYYYYVGIHMHMLHLKGRVMYQKIYRKVHSFLHRVKKCILKQTRG